MGVTLGSFSDRSCLCPSSVHFSLGMRLPAKIFGGVSVWVQSTHLQMSDNGHQPSLEAAARNGAGIRLLPAEAETSKRSSLEAEAGAWKLLFVIKHSDTNAKLNIFQKINNLRSLPEMMWCLTMMCGAAGCWAPPLGAGVTWPGLGRAHSAVGTSLPSQPGLISVICDQQGVTSDKDGGKPGNSTHLWSEHRASGSRLYHEHGSVLCNPPLQSWWEKSNIDILKNA